MTALTVKEQQLHFLFQSSKCGFESINILLTGKTGVGKSSLINAIVGELLAQEGKCLGGVTRDVTCHERTVNHIKFKIWDSPGLQDITEEDGEITKRIMQTLKQHCSHLHLLLYCIRMDRDRVEISELQAIKQLSQLFSPKIWESAIFALTFANRVIPPPEMETDEEEARWFKERTKYFQERIVKALVENGVPEDKAKQLPVIPTGYHKPTKHIPNPLKLYDRPDWFNPFWHSCAKQMEKSKIIMMFLASQKHRIQIVTGKTTSDKAQEIAEKQQELKRKGMESKEESRMQQLKIEKECQQLEEAEEIREIEEQSQMMENCKEREQDQREEENHQQQNQGENDVQTQFEEQQQERQIQIKNKRDQLKRRLEEHERRKKELENDYDRDYRRLEEELMKLTEAQATTAESHDWKIEVSASSSWGALIEKTNNISPGEPKEEVKPMQKRNESDKGNALIPLLASQKQRVTVVEEKQECQRQLKLHICADRTKKNPKLDESTKTPEITDANNEVKHSSETPSTKETSEGGKKKPEIHQSLSAKISHDTTPPTSNQKEIEKYKKLVRLLRDKNFDAKGVAFVIGISGPEGVEIDVENMTSTFKELNLAVSSHNNLTSSELISLLHVASTFVYPPGYRFIVFYYAGHGGVDPDNGSAYVLPLQLQEAGDPEKVYIEDAIVSRFSTESSPSLEYRFRIFLFDCCLSTQSTRNNPEDLSTKQQKFDLKARGGCLVAYATSRSYKSEGDSYRGGLWTYHLHRNLKLPLTISGVLDRTHDAVMKESMSSGRIQEPNYHSCIGEVYLKVSDVNTEVKPSVETTPKETNKITSTLHTPKPVPHEDNITLPKKPAGETYQDVLQKPPEQTDVFDLVRNTSSSWFDIGSELHVPLNVREGLRKDISLSDDAKLEKILNEWIKFETVDVTWETILKALQALRRKDIMRETLQYLGRPDIYSKYIKKDDFTPVPDFP